MIYRDGHLTNSLILDFYDIAAIERTGKVLSGIKHKFAANLE